MATKTKNKGDLLSNEQAAQRMGLKPASLAVMRQRGDIRIPFIRIGRKVLYRPEDVDAFIEARVVTPQAAE